MFTFKRYLEYLAKREHFTPPALLYRQQFSEQGAEQKDLYVSPLARPLPALPLAETAEPGRPILADPAPVPAVEKCLPGLAGVPDALSISIPTDHDYENLVAQLAQSEENEG
jgi:hypothetical protein